MWDFIRAFFSKRYPRALYDGQPYFCLTCGRSLDAPACERHHPETPLAAMRRANRFTKGERSKHSAIS